MPSAAFPSVMPISWIVLTSFCAMSFEPGKPNMPLQWFPPLICGCALTVSALTMPKLWPAPRIAQKRSWFSVAEAVTMDPVAVTRRAETMLSEASPKLETRLPMPPPLLKSVTIKDANAIRPHSHDRRHGTDTIAGSSNWEWLEYVLIPQRNLEHTNVRISILSSLNELACSSAGLKSG